MLQQLFIVKEVRLICSFPLSFRRQPNRLMWYFNKKEVFSVKKSAILLEWYGLLLLWALEVDLRTMNQ
ncbi:hypothetical protein DVH24_025822 [Malus domestica]|uniref:Uncharacterized protein n=1 Tax=Malus domestica TaxID=3750 RepID=A0A498KH25_MALDO|nr:hypothetical protein DVH24_025822 [Malus domestica]